MSGKERTSKQNTQISSVINPQRLTANTMRFFCVYSRTLCRVVVCFDVNFCFGKADCCVCGHFRQDLTWTDLWVAKKSRIVPLVNKKPYMSFDMYLIFFFFEDLGFVLTD